jgi:DNA-binding transcriptional LysR family regulator
MDQFKQISTFTEVIAKGSLSAAARAEGIAPAMIGRRLDALEERLGVKLLQRSTRKIALTDEGAAFLEDCQRILAELENAESAVSERSARCDRPMMAFIGVRISWLMLARKSLLARLALRACSVAASSCRSMRLRSVMSVRDTVAT